MQPAAADSRTATDVLIVGAGPTGLALATTLARAGVVPTIVDRLASAQHSSRAAVVHAHTLEVLESLGVADRMRREGLQLARFSIRDRDRVLLRLRFDTLPSKFACLLMLPQDRTEAILADALVAAGGAVRWGCDVEALAANADGVDATLVSDQGRQTIRARWVVGADGMHSRVRESAGIGFEGHSYEESFVLADVDLDWAHGRDEVMLFFSPQGLLVVAPLPDGRHRLVATLAAAPAEPSVADMQALLRERGPRSAGTVLAVHWSSRFRLHHRVADHYRRGPFVLVGDAAHVHSPAGGQGMNTGLVDACVLGRALADVVRGRRSEGWLDVYAQLRRPAAVQVLALAGRLTRLATLRGAPQRAVRNLALRAAGVLPMVRRRLTMNFSGLSRRQASHLPESP